jgi:DNA helicase II / ATP-dependent DNA helicase PcrA
VEIKKQYLPKIAKFQPKKITPSNEQLAIQLATQKIILIDANAGAAKTTTLALRMAESLARGVAPEDMLALTVTSAAQQVMRQRLKDIGVPAAVVKKITCETFEGLAQQILLQIERVQVPCFADENDLIPLALDALDQVSNVYGTSRDLEIQTHNVAVHAFFRMQMNIKARMLLSIHDLEGYTDEEIAYVLKVPLTTYLWHLEYEKMRDGVLRGPGDAAYDLVQWLAQQARQQAQPERDLPRYKAIFADELHDLNEVVFRLLTMLIQVSGAFFCGAGDKDQVIYSWQGADHQYLRHRFQATFPNMVTWPLTLCYRHGPILAEAVARFKKKENQSGVALATAIERVRYAPGGGAASVLSALNKYHNSGGERNKSAILLRSPSQSIQIEYALIQASIEHKVEAMPRFFQRLEILMLRGMVALALGDLDKVASIPVRRMIFEAMPIFTEIELDQQQRRDWEGIVKSAIDQPNSLEWFFSGVLVRQAKGVVKERLIACYEYLQSLPKDMLVAEALRQICRHLRLPEVTRRVFVDPQQAAMVQDSVDQFIELCRSKGIQLQQFSAWLGDLEQQTAAKNVVALTIACVDDIKGKEYNAVFLPYLEEGQFPRKGMPLLEEENRFYVAITRARLDLFLFLPAASTESDCQEPIGKPSSFLERMKG